MSTLHFRFWPKGTPRQIHACDTSLFSNLQISALRFPDKPAIVFYDTVISYRRLLAEVEALAGYLQQVCRVARGDRVLLFAQNCPQFVIAYYAILRADAVVVPVNAMSTAHELEHYVSDSGARVVILASELQDRVTAWMRPGMLEHAVTLRYADYLEQRTDLPLPAGLTDVADVDPVAPFVSWKEALQRQCLPAPHAAGPDDLSVMPYTSGTTGRPKGCMHTHGSVMHATVACTLWRQLHSESVFLCVAPMFHVLGMQNGMNVPLYAGGTMVLMSRWDRSAAASLIERYRVSTWAAPPAMVVDFFANPSLATFDLSSLALLCGGGAAMPEAVGAMLRDRFGITYAEAYGLSETASFLHSNPLGRNKQQCIGMPTFNVDSRVVDVETLRELLPGEVGEIITSGPQVMRGYWRNPEADAESFIERDGKRFFRTGDLGHVDEDGYFFVRDRLKRMINVSGYKVWPAEIENMLYQHPAVHEACVVSMPDERGGERVRAVVVLKAGTQASEEEIIHWARGIMAAYKVPRVVEFVAALPKSGSGKILWRDVQAQTPDASGPGTR